MPPICRDAPSAVLLVSDVEDGLLVSSVLDMAIAINSDVIATIPILRMFIVLFMIVVGCGSVSYYDGK